MDGGEGPLPLLTDDCAPPCPRSKTIANLATEVEKRGYLTQHKATVKPQQWTLSGEVLVMLAPGMEVEASPCSLPSHHLPEPACAPLPFPVRLGPSRGHILFSESPSTRLHCLAIDAVPFATRRNPSACPLRIFPRPDGRHAPRKDTGGCYKLSIGGRLNQLSGHAHTSAGVSRGTFLLPPSRSPFAAPPPTSCFALSLAPVSSSLCLPRTLGCFPLPV